MQEAIVALIVACSAWAIARRYAPNRLRQAARGWALLAARRAGWERMAVSLEAKKQAAASCATGCGSCGGCGTAAKAPAVEQATISLENLRRSKTP